MENESTVVTTEEFHKEIDLIQSCINRMAQNSFMIKGWAYAIIVALIALLAEKVSLYVLCSIGIFVLLSFWWLDAFFLKTEKLYRFKYNWILSSRPVGNRLYLYDLSPTNKKMWIDTPLKEREKTDFQKAEKITIIGVMFSPSYTLLIFYGVPIFFAIVLTVMGFFDVV